MLRKILFIFLLLHALTGYSQRTKEKCVEMTLHFSKWIAEEKGDSIVPHLDTVMSRMLNASQMNDLWTSLIMTYGEVRAKGKVNAEEKDEYIVTSQQLDFEKTRMNFTVTFDRQMKVAGLYIRPQGNLYDVPDYAKTLSFVEYKVRFGNDPVFIDGMLTIGKENKKYPLVIILGGSGPQDMDGSIAMNKIYKDLAWGIASQGIAVYRYPKRTYLYGSLYLSGKKEVGYTMMEEYVEDALLAIGKMRSRNDIDTNRIYLLGHSQGGDAAILTARLDGRIKGIIMASTTPRSLQDVMCEQLDYIYGYEPVGSYRYNLVQQQKNRLEFSMNPALSSDVPADSLPMNIIPQYWQFLNHFNKIDSLKNLTGTQLFFIQGKRDYQVTTVDFDIWKKELSSRLGTEFKLYPYLNHLYFKGYGRSTAVEYEERHHVDPEVINDIVNWIKK